MTGFDLPANYHSDLESLIRSLAQGFLNQVLLDPTCERLLTNFRDQHHHMSPH
jgi:hypothetical protein